MIQLIENNIFFRSLLVSFFGLSLDMLCSIFVISNESLLLFQLIKELLAIFSFTIAIVIGIFSLKSLTENTRSNNNRKKYKEYNNSVEKNDTMDDLNDASN